MQRLQRLSLLTTGATALLLAGCALTSLNREELLQGINAGTLPPIGLTTPLKEKTGFFTSKKVVLQERIDGLRKECGEEVLIKVRSATGFPTGETISRNYLDQESIAVLGPEEAARSGRVRYQITASGGRGATFGPCANMRELLLIDGKAVLDGPYQYCEPLPTKK